jgi:hypothetical protein
MLNIFLFRRATILKLVKDLQLFVNIPLRSILYIRWPEVISNEHNCNRTKQAPIKNEIKKGKWG